jgi:hypothetical protein
LCFCFVRIDLSLLRFAFGSSLFAPFFQIFDFLLFDFLLFSFDFYLLGLSKSEKISFKNRWNFFYPDELTTQKKVGKANTLSLGPSVVENFVDSRYRYDHDTI